MEQIMRREGVVKDGSMKEIDLIGKYRLYNRQEENKGLGAWFVSMHYREDRMSDKEV